MDIDHDRPAKRQKLDSHQPRPSYLPTRADEIHGWLKFQQSTDVQVRDGIQAFKNYLSTVSQLENIAKQSQQFQILKEYCDWQRAASDDQLNFHDLLSTWSFAVENNAEAISSASPAALAQFLKTISGILELRTYGLALIDSLLRRDQTKLFEKCFASPRSKPHLASPCLRLLTEMVSFDAGARANEVWLRRDLFIPKIDALLEQQNTSIDLEDRRKPSVRRMTLRLVLAILRYTDTEARADLLIQARALHACLRGLVDDGDDIIVDFVRAIDTYIIEDAQLHRTAIIRFFNIIHLDHLAALYSFETEENDDEAKVRVRDATQKLLLKLCASDIGVLLPTSGWLSSSSASNIYESYGDDYIELGLDSPFLNTSSTDKIVVNGVLSVFLQKLKPYEDLLQSELTLAILKSAPELVADYFSRHNSFPVPDSDDPAWRSAFTFVFSILELPIPSLIDNHQKQHRTSPSLVIATESILPRPLDRTYLSKLLASRDEILKVSGARVLVVALKKLSEAQTLFTKYSQEIDWIWQQASDKLVELLEERIPNVRDVSLALQHTSYSDATSYTALLECLLAYHESLPNAVTASTFDVGPAMAELCTKLETAVEASKGDTSELRLQLALGAKIAALSTSTKWLHKPDNESLTPLTRLLKLTLSADTLSDNSKGILRNIQNILTHCGILLPSDLSFSALCSSLIASKNFSPLPELFIFLDNCIVRTYQKPVRLLDEVDTKAQIVSDKKPLSLLAAAVLDQWPFVLKKHSGNKSVLKNAVVWIARFFALLDLAGENYRVTTNFRDTMVNATTGKVKEYLQEALERIRKKPVSLEAAFLPVTSNQNIDAMKVNEGENKDTKTLALEDLKKLGTKITSNIPTSLAGLDKWPTTAIDVDLEIRTSRLPRLILLVSSPDEELRIQAFQLLRTISHTVDTQSISEHKTQIFLLLGELVETVRQHGTTNPLPTAVPELATTLLKVIIEPTHRLFAKANKFLLHAPSWSPKRTVTYWLDHILLQEPDTEDDEAFTHEVTWLLQWLLSSLRTTIDLDLTRRAGLWERNLSLYSSPTMTSDTKQLILAMIYRACQIPGGVEMLWTRCGVSSWLQAMEMVDIELSTYLQALRAEMDGKCDKEGIERWKCACSLTKAKEKN